MQHVYQFNANAVDGRKISMDQYKGKVLLIVNTASNCGFTPQYKALQDLFARHRDKGFEVLAFPSNQFRRQEPGSNSEIKLFCETNFNTSFTIFEKIDVKGKNAHPLYVYLTREAPGVFGTKEIKWNFTKFLVDRNGIIVKRYSPMTKPEKIEPDIIKLL